MRKLFLDDLRQPPDFTWDVVRSYDQFITWIKLNGVPDIISFDHDLGQEHYEFVDWSGNAIGTEIPYDKFTEKTGYDCAKWLVEQGLLPRKYQVHSMNIVGKKNIEFIMESAYRNNVGG